MEFRRRKTVFRFVLAAIAALGISAFLANCDSPTRPRAGDGPVVGGPTLNGDTRLVIGIHGSQMPLAQAIAQYVGIEPLNAHAIEGIEALLLSVRQIELRGSRGRRYLLEEDRVIDILAASRLDPVILSDVSVEPGVYSEIRLILNEDSQIRVNGEYHPLRIPSGTSSGLKLKGPVEIPQGVFFTLNIELDTARSVSWNRGQGYRLHPVLNISTGPEVLGIFRGRYTAFGLIGYGETLVQLFNDNTARLRVARYPNYTFWFTYNYNSITRLLTLDNMRFDAPGLGSREVQWVMENFPDRIILPVRQWSLDSVIVIDSMGLTANLYRVDEFSFSRGITFTEFTLHVDHPSLTGSGWYVLTEVHFIDTGMPFLTEISPKRGGRTTKRIAVPNDSIQGTSTRIRVTSYLFRSFDDINLEVGTFASMPTLMLASSSRIHSSTTNSWRPSAPVFRLFRDTGGEFTVSFPRSMNVRMDHRNFTNNNPVVSWVPYPGASGYLVVAIVQNKGREPGNAFFIPAFHYFTYGTSVTLDSEMISFTPTGLRPAQINRGDFIIIEVYALDGSGFLDTRNRTGALFRDTLTVVR
ncbi:MAG: DUF4382 domain-containing protein [Treponema sp.]|nr:DUF4382 domain-containing protein [Treponema sp.]